MKMTPIAILEGNFNLIGKTYVSLDVDGNEVEQNRIEAVEESLSGTEFRIYFLEEEELQFVTFGMDNEITIK